MINNRKAKMLIILYLVMAIIVYPVLPVAAESDYSKISPDIQKIIQRNATTEREFIEVIIILQDQAKTENTRNKILNEIPHKATSEQEKTLIRNGVVESLQETARKGQESLLSYLEKERASGRVAEIKSYYIVNGIYAEMDTRLISAISRRPDIKKIILNTKIAIEKPEIDNNRWFRPMAGGEPEWNIEQIGAPAVWDDFGVDGTGVVVGIIDTGVDWEHDALKTKWRGYDPLDPFNPDPVFNWFDAVNGEVLPVDFDGHGTHVTGTILGSEPGGNNKIGVAPGATWIAANTFSGNYSEDVWLLDAGEYMIAPLDAEGNPTPEMAPDIINNSWGSSMPGDSDEWYRLMVQNWRAAGILPIFAAGNSGPYPGSVSAPGTYPEAFSVAATDSNKDLAYFSSRGPTSYFSPDDLKPDISAPGANIRSAVPGGDYEGGWNGTSMAAPHIAGVAALLLSANNSLNPNQLETIMIHTAEPLTDFEYPESPNYGYGYGLVNAYNAVSFSTYGTITGQVLAEGEDSEPPLIEHEPLETAWLGLDLHIEANLSDNIAIIDPKLHYSPENDSEWYSIPLKRVSGNARLGTYRAIIADSDLSEPGFDYYIKVSDWGGNEITGETHKVTVKPPIVPGTIWDFETEPSDWEWDGCWEWGEPDYIEGPEAFIGNNLMGTVLNGNYDDDSYSVLLMPPLDLKDTELPDASLRLKQWYDIEEYFDYGGIFISNDGGNRWELVSNVEGQSFDWSNLYIDLTYYIGSETPLLIAFLFVSDNEITYPGWYIDNVHFIGEDNDAPAPITDLTAEPLSYGIELNWTAPMDPDVLVYNIYRKEVGGGEYALLAQNFSPGYIDTNLLEDVEYSYMLRAIDYAGNHSDDSNTATAVAPTFSILYYSNFETDDGGFTSHGDENEWEWGIPESGPYSAYNGEKVWGTNLTGIYPDFSDSWIESPEIDLTGYSEALLSFHHWHDLELNYDWGDVYVIYDDGESRELLAENTGWTAFWDQQTISLSDYTGKIIQIAFNLYSDEMFAFDGWYIDDVAIVASNAGAGSEINLQYQAASPGTNTARPARKAPADSEKPVTEKYSIDKTNVNLLNRKNPERSYTLNTIPVPGYIPLDALITIIETGRTADSNSSDGTFTLITTPTPESEELTLRITSPGYIAKELSYTLEADETLNLNKIILEISTEIKYGDITGSGTVSVGDAILLSRAIVGLETLTPQQKISADVNGDNRLSVADAILIARFIVGLIDKFPVEE